MGVVEETLKERGSRYGTLEANGKIAQSLKQLLRESPNWDSLSCDKKEALDNITQKIARLLTGDPEYVDNWLDIEGYARLVREEIERKTKDVQGVTKWFDPDWNKSDVNQLSPSNGTP